ncbi:hypothetical protein A0J61_11969, partial [Choanephora cucurbitarum]
MIENDSMALRLQSPPNNRRVFFDNDYANPSEGFYCYQDNRGNNTHSDRRNPNDNPEPHTSRQYNDDTELYAARMTQPPTVSDSRLNTDKTPKRVSKPSLKAKERAESVKRTVKDAVSPYITAPNPIPFTQPTYQTTEPMMDVTPTPFQPSSSTFFTPAGSTSVIPNKGARRIRTKADPSAMNYDIAEDVLKTKANIAIGDLI